MTFTHDVCVVGAGAAGLTAAGGLAMLGLRVALVERGTMGGECLNTGCVPSKALLAAAAVAQGVRDAARFGVRTAEPEVDFQAVMRFVHGAIAAIAPHDARKRFEAMGVEVVAAEARFLDRRTLLAGNRRIAAARYVIATGSKPAVPDLPGLASVPFLTTDTLFQLTEQPEHLAILGGGPIGIEMAQAFRRLGSKVTVVEPQRALAREDPEAAGVVLDRLRAEGVRLCEGQGVATVEGGDNFVNLRLQSGETVSASHLLVATGRRAPVEGLDFGAAGVAVEAGGITVDPQRRTSNRRIMAIGDCRAGPRFTHVAGAEGSLVVQAIGLGWPAKASYAALPRVIYTDPELAQAGLTEAEARARHDTVRIETAAFADNDRAVTEGDTAGFVRTVRAGGRLVGVTIVGAHAGELLLPWTQILAGKASLFQLAGTTVAYPTRSEQSKAAAFAGYMPLVSGSTARRWARVLARLHRWT